MSINREKQNTEIISLRDAMDRMLAESFILPRTWMAHSLGAEFIPLDIYEEANDLVVKAPVPGVKPEDLNIEVREDVLTISGEIKQEKERKEEAYHMHEQRYGRFERSVALPCVVNVDKAKTEFEDGILTLTLPKVAAAKGKKIAVQPKEKPAGKPKSKPEK
ncbi:MAG TPA: Hsp20/alpha crystallin family protein [Anaerolineales bacterium]|nr:Hsp20/alpha crystallin family protein [Anaerolineales bacterium]